MIALHEVSKRYGERAVIEGITLSVACGEVLALVGGSGSGKTTTLKTINRLVEPSSGRIEIDGVDTSTIPRHVLCRRIGYVFQRIGLLPHLTVARNIAVPLELAGRTRAEIAPRLSEVARLVALDEELLDRLPRELSGGQQQRAGVARAIAASPQILLFDEPFGALDPLTRDYLQETFLSLRQALGFTGVFVTHDMAEAAVVADRVAVMRDGRLIQIGTPGELVERPADSDVERLMSAPVRSARAFEAAISRARRG